MMEESTASPGETPAEPSQAEASSQAASGQHEVHNEASTTSHEHLSRHERKKLKKMQHKEQQALAHGQHKQKKLMKKIIYGVLGALLVIGLFFLVSSLTKEVLPSVRADDPFLGPKDSPVTVIEFGDLQCPYTTHFHDGAFKELQKEYGDKIKWVFHHMPTGKHALSREAANAAECAKEQGKYFAYIEQVFDKEGADKSSLLGYGRILELDMDKFTPCVEENKYSARVQEDYLEGKGARVRLTPTFFINGIKFEGDLAASAFKPLFDEILRAK